MRGHLKLSLSFMIYVEPPTPRLQELEQNIRSAEKSQVVYRRALADQVRDRDCSIEDAVPF